ncbi:hypothetical protein [Niabella sp.]|uniref:hypothetical protein n=1 Tax=Niabella sp. TaxID=1962976 RepID=UPI00263770B4|nr:hypothetical protein [Niabella sp.]
MADVLDQEMFSYFTQLNNAEKKSVVQMLKTFLKSRPEKSERMSPEDYDKELEAAMKEVLNNETYSHEEIVRIARNW